MAIKTKLITKSHDQKKKTLMNAAVAMGAVIGCEAAADQRWRCGNKQGGFKAVL